MTLKVKNNAIHPPYPIFATDTYIHNFILHARSRSATSRYKVVRYRRYILVVAIERKRRLLY